MDQLIYLVIASAVLVMAASSILLITSETGEDILSFSDTANDVECQTQANQWDKPDDSIDEECIDKLGENERKDAIANSVASELT